MIASAKSARLLVVEDEIITARDLQDSLEELGYSVPEIASSGSEALDLAAALRPDLVLMDINLGGGSDGVEIAAEMRERYGLPVIYLTAYADQATLKRAASTAPLGYLTKPFDRRELHATIQMALVKRQMDEQLRQSESWFSTSLSSIGDGVIATDTAGRVKFVNPVASAMMGWSPAEALGRPLDEVFPLFDKETRQPRPGLAERVLARGETVCLEEGTLLRARDGQFHPLDDSAAPIRGQRDGELLGVVVVFRDVSEKQQIAAELERARRLESLGTLAGGLAHDLNNILAIIAGNVSLATQPGAALELQTRAFAKIETAVRRAKALTGQFLTFSKGGEPIRRATDLRALLREEMDLMFEESEQAARVIHSLDADPSLWNVEADEGQIRRVIENLLRNATQALPIAGGRIMVRAVNCAREALPAAALGAPREMDATHFVRIEVADTGCGIPEENFAHVCEPYFTTRTTGSGLGLSVCNSIARKHGGSLVLRSAAGEGTTASLYLPACIPEAPVAETGCPAPSAASAEPGLRVLVMDDELLMRDLLPSMLEHLGHESATAATGEETLKLYGEAAAAGRPFDVVFVDLVNKLGMGGQELIVKLLAADPNAVALVCSGYSDHPIMANFGTYGFKGCLPKPLGLGQMDQALQQVMDRKRQRG